MIKWKMIFLTILAIACIPTLRAQVDTVTILHLNDTHSTLASIGPRDAQLKGSLGGIARAASIIGMTKLEEPNTLLLHAGDLFIGDMFFNQYFGVPEFQILLALGCDAMAVGNHEFDLTPATLKMALDTSFTEGSFPLLSANTILDSAAVQGLKQYILPYVIKQAGNVKVGIFGLTTPATNVLSLPSPAVVDSDFVGIAAAYVDTLVNQNCDVIICLSHLGLMYDQLLASYVPGIHAIVGGHDHYALESPIAVQNPLGDTTWIVQANAFYLNVGKLRLTVQDTIVRLLDYALIPIDDTVPEEPTIAATVDMLIQGIEGVYGPAYTQQLTYAAEYFEEVEDSLMELGYRDTPVGNLVTDAFRALTKTDVAIEVGGSTAQPLYQGPIVGADVFRMVGYGFNTDNGLGYRMATLTMTGEALMMGLEFGLSTIGENDEFLVQASGLTYWYAPSRPHPDEIGDTLWNRLLYVEIGGQPIDPVKEYTVTANEFVPAFMDYLGIPYSNLHVMTDTTEYQAVVWYLADKDTIRPAVRNRVLSPVEQVSALAPEKFELHQNYPNPFNPTTVIRFDLPERGLVKLEVFDLLGRRVATLVDDVLQAGRQTVEFDAHGLSSGVYLYKIEANGFAQARRMVLVR